MIHVSGQGAHAQVGADPEKVLKPNARVQTWFSFFDSRDVLLDRKALPIPRHEWIGQRDPNIVLVRVSPRRGGVARSVDEMMVIQIVCGHPHQRWVTVKN